MGVNSLPKTVTHMATWRFTNFVLYCIVYYCCAPDTGAKYCDECVCLSVCLSVCLCWSVHGHIFGTTHPIFTNLIVHVCLSVCSDVTYFVWSGT